MRSRQCLLYSPRFCPVNLYASCRNGHLRPMRKELIMGHLILEKTLQTTNMSVLFQEKFCCQALLYLSLSLSLSFYLYLYLYLLEREKADTIITLYHHHHCKLFKDLRGDLYSSVIHHWNRQLKPYSFPLRKNRVN